MSPLEQLIFGSIICWLQQFEVCILITAIGSSYQLGSVMWLAISQSKSWRNVIADFSPQNIWYWPTIKFSSGQVALCQFSYGVCSSGVQTLTWWRHQMITFSALLALCVENSPVTGEFPRQRPVTRSFDIFFHLYLNKRLSKQSWGWWFETPSRSLWRHSNVSYYRETWAPTIYPT